MERKEGPAQGARECWVRWHKVRNTVEAVSNMEARPLTELPGMEWVRMVEALPQEEGKGEAPGAGGEALEAVLKQAQADLRPGEGVSDPISKALAEVSFELGFRTAADRLRPPAHPGAGSEAGDYYALWHEALGRAEAAEAKLAAQGSAPASRAAIDEARAIELVKSWQGSLWDAINIYMLSCGGHSSKGGTKRMHAVARFNRLLECLLMDIHPVAPTPPSSEAPDKGET